MATSSRVGSSRRCLPGEHAIHADIRAYNDKLEPDVRKICDRLAREIGRSLKEAESKVWHAHPVWFLGGNPVVGYGKLKDCVRLLFWSGQSFEEEGLAKEGSFKAAEARFKAASEIDTEALQRWLAKAREIQWDYKNIVKRKGQLLRLRVATANADKADAPPRLIDARIKELGDWRGETLARVRALIHEADPEVVEEWKWRGVPVWSHDGQICTGESYKKVVKLTFLKGAKLTSRLFNSSLEGNARRAIDIQDGESLDAAAFQTLIRSAVALNTSAGTKAQARPRLKKETRKASTP